jgi:hypothetical protein
MTQSILVDTSTLMELRLHDPDALSGFGQHNAAAIEALVLFEQVYLDGRTTDSELAPMHWLDELDDGVTRVNNAYTEVRETYDRGLLIAGDIGKSRHSYDRLVETATSGTALQELGVPARYAAKASSRRYERGNGQLWRDLEPYLSRGMGQQTSEVVDRLVTMIHPAPPGTVMMLARLCYYLALQEQLGSYLLLHPDKAYGTQASYGYARRIMDIFDERVAKAYLERRREWLGESEREIPLPLLARHVIRESQERGWSLGRTISWMRTQPEVRLFRQGMRELVSRIESKDDVGTDAILADLEAAAEAWSKRLGAKIGSRRVSLQVAIPIISPSVDVPVPKLSRTPADKLLVLIGRLLHSPA